MNVIGNDCSLPAAYIPSSLEPAHLKRARWLEDLVARASRLTQGLHPTVVTTLGELVRSVNFYYSTLIEGHQTLPVEILSGR